MKMQELDGRFSAVQDVGDRDYQEDDFGLLDGRDLRNDGTENTLLVLADGMGGHQAGDVASRLAVKTVITEYQSMSGPVVDRLRESLYRANGVINNVIAEDPLLDGMGCTLVLVLISNKGVEWLSVGDSPLWLFQNNDLIRLNADHSMTPVLEELVEVGKITREDADNDPQKNTLRSAIYGEEVNLIDVSSQPKNLATGDLVILASDGLETLSKEEIEKVLRSNIEKDLEEINQQLILSLKNQGKENQDNTTVLLYRPESRDSDETKTDISSQLEEEITIKIGSQERSKDSAQNDVSASIDLEKPQVKAVRFGFVVSLVVCIFSALIFSYIGAENLLQPRPVKTHEVKGSESIVTKEKANVEVLNEPLIETNPRVYSIPSVPKVNDSEVGDDQTDKDREGGAKDVKVEKFDKEVPIKRVQKEKDQKANILKPSSTKPISSKPAAQKAGGWEMSNQAEGQNKPGIEEGSVKKKQSSIDDKKEQGSKPKVDEDIGKGGG